MEITIQDNNYISLSPQIKRARTFIVVALTIEFIMSLIWGVFYYKLLAALDWNIVTSGTLNTWCNGLTIVLFIAGYFQFYLYGKMENNNAIRFAGIILSIGSLLDFLLPIGCSYLFDYYRTRLTYSGITSLIYVLGISMLWLASYDDNRRILNFIVSVYLFKIGYLLFNYDLLISHDLFNPLCYSLHTYNEHGSYSSQIPIINSIFPLVLMYLWVKFCNNAYPDPTMTNSDIVQGLRSRPFIAFIICCIVLYFAIESLSNLILS